MHSSDATRAPATHHLLAGQRRVPGKEERARLLVQGDEHGPVGGPGLRPAHEADHTLVLQAGLGGTGGPFLIHQLEDLVHVGQPRARLAHADPGLPEAGPCAGRESRRENTVTDPNGRVPDENPLHVQTFKSAADMQNSERPMWF